MSQPVPNPPLDAPQTRPQDNWHQKVSGTLINSETLLATDYLNHFNEVVMLVEMVPDMPDMLPDCQSWKLKSYPEHFAASGLDYGELAAEAYEHVSQATKLPFEMTVAQLAATIKLTLERLDMAVAMQDTEQARAIAKAGTSAMHALIERAGGIINGAKESLDHADIDRMLEAAPAPTGGGAQADIDKLFG